MAKLGSTQRRPPKLFRVNICAMLVLYLLAWQSMFVTAAPEQDTSDSDLTPHEHADIANLESKASSNSLGKESHHGPRLNRQAQQRILYHVAFASAEAGTYYILARDLPNFRFNCKSNIHCTSALQGIASSVANEIMDENRDFYEGKHCGLTCFYDRAPEVSAMSMFKAMYRTITLWKHAEIKQYRPRDRPEWEKHMGKWDHKGDGVHGTDLEEIFAHLLNRGHGNSKVIHTDGVEEARKHLSDFTLDLGALASLDHIYSVWHPNATFPVTTTLKGSLANATSWNATHASASGLKQAGSMADSPTHHFADQTAWAKGRSGSLAARARTASDSTGNFSTSSGPPIGIPVSDPNQVPTPSQPFGIPVSDPNHVLTPSPPFSSKTSVQRVLGGTAFLEGLLRWGVCVAENYLCPAKKVDQDHIWPTLAALFHGLKYGAFREYEPLRHVLDPIREGRRWDFEQFFPKGGKWEHKLPHHWREKVQKALAHQALIMKAGERAVYMMEPEMRYNLFVFNRLTGILVNDNVATVPLEDMPPWVKKIGYITAQSIDRYGRVTGSGIYVRPVKDFETMHQGTWAAIAMDPNKSIPANDTAAQDNSTSARDFKRDTDIDDERKEVAIVMGTTGGTFAAVLPFGIEASKRWWPNVEKSRSVITPKWPAPHATEPSGPPLIRPAGVAGPLNHIIWPFSWTTPRFPTVPGDAVVPRSIGSPPESLINSGAFRGVWEPSGFNPTPFGPQLWGPDGWMAGSTIPVGYSPFDEPYWRPTMEGWDHLVPPHTQPQRFRGPETVRRYLGWRAADEVTGQIVESGAVHPDAIPHVFDDIAGPELGEASARLTSSESMMMRGIRRYQYVGPSGEPLSSVMYRAPGEAFNIPGLSPGESLSSRFSSSLVQARSASSGMSGSNPIGDTVLRGINARLDPSESWMYTSSAASVSDVGGSEAGRAGSTIDILEPEAIRPMGSATDDTMAWVMDQSGRRPSRLFGSIRNFHLVQMKSMTHLKLVGKEVGGSVQHALKGMVSPITKIGPKATEAIRHIREAAQAIHKAASVGEGIEVAAVLGMDAVSAAGSTISSALLSAFFSEAAVVGFAIGGAIIVILDLAKPDKSCPSEKYYTEMWNSTGPVASMTTYLDVCSMYPDSGGSIAAGPTTSASRPVTATSSAVVSSIPHLGLPLPATPGAAVNSIVDPRPRVTVNPGDVVNSIAGPRLKALDTGSIASLSPSQTPSPSQLSTASASSRWMHIAPRRATATLLAATSTSLLNSGVPSPSAGLPQPSQWFPLGNNTTIPVTQNLTLLPPLPPWMFYNNNTIPLNVNTTAISFTPYQDAKNCSKYGTPFDGQIGPSQFRRVQMLPTYPCGVLMPYECTDQWYHERVNDLPVGFRNPWYCEYGNPGMGHHLAVQLGCFQKDHHGKENFYDDDNKECRNLFKIWNRKKEELKKLKLIREEEEDEQEEEEGHHDHHHHGKRQWEGWEHKEEERDLDGDEDDLEGDDHGDDQHKSN